MYFNFDITGHPRRKWSRTSTFFWAYLCACYFPY